MEKFSEEDDSVEITLRDPAAVAVRALILAALCHRAFIEIESEQADAPDADEDRFDLLAWLHDENLADHTSTRERGYFRAPVGAIDAEDTLALSWSAETLAVLCWSLGLMPALPAFDETTPVQPLLELLPEPGSSSAAFRRSPQLLHEDRITAARETAELWHWRATMQELLDGATGSEREELHAVIRDTAAEGASLGLLPQPIDDDFPVHGVAYADATDHDSLAAIAEWRLRALNWLCGFGETWDTVPLDL